jgi:riboflavin kinase/FMN adenylyltransferase
LKIVVGAEMQVEAELARQAPEQDTLLTVGGFDGVHRGPQHLISHLREGARQKNLLSGVVSFKHHPRQVLRPQSGLPHLTGLKERTRLLKGLGIDLVVTLSFTPTLAQLTARQFVALLKQHLRMQGLVIGPDFALGRQREGNTANLVALGKEMAFTVDVVPPAVIDGEVASSTVVRAALAEGNMKRVSELLGRQFGVEGRVTTGSERGRVLGFPTANLAFQPHQALPPDGVYISRAYVDAEPYQSVTNIGQRPTFDAGERTVEVYLLDFEGDLYGRELRIELVERLRAETRFASAEELKAQIAKDVEQARAALTA